MDNLHSVMRSIRGETKARRDHLTVFREFLDHLDRVTKSRARAARTGRGKTASAPHDAANAASAAGAIIVAAPSPDASRACPTCA